MYCNTLLRGASAGAILLVLAPAALAQEALPSIDVGAEQTAPDPAPAPAAVEAPPGFSPQKLRLPVYREPTGQTFTNIDTEDFSDSPLTTVSDILEYSSGMSFKQGNGPRDIAISIAALGPQRLGVRNIVLEEDGFSVIQPDGFVPGRFDRSARLCRRRRLSRPIIGVVRQLGQRRRDQFPHTHGRGNRRRGKGQ